CLGGPVASAPARSARRWAGRPRSRVDGPPPVPATQLREVVGRLRHAGQHTPGDPDILIVFDAGYDVTRLAFLLADLPVELLGRLRSDRVFCAPPPPRVPSAAGPPSKPRPEFPLA